MAWSRMEVVGQTVVDGSGGLLEGSGAGGGGRGRSGDEVKIQTQVVRWMVQPVPAIQKAGVTEGSVGRGEGKGQWPWARWQCPEVLDPGGIDAEGGGVE